MGELQHPLEEGEVEMGLVFKLAREGLLLLAKVIAGASLHVNKDSGKTDPFKIRPVFSIKGFAAGAHKGPDPRTLEPVQCRFKLFVILDGDRLHPKGPGHLAGIAYRAPAAFITALQGPVGTVHLFCAIGQKENLGSSYLREGFQDREKMMSLFFTEPVRDEIHLLDRLSYRLNEVAFLDPGDPGLPVNPKGVNDLLDLRRRGFRILEEAFKIKDRPFGIGKEIAR